MEWEKQGNAFTSVKSPFASSLGQAGWPLTSIQLCNMSTSSSSLVVGFASSSSDSSEGESYRKKAVQTGTIVNLFSKVIKKKRGNSKLPVLLSPSTSPSRLLLLLSYCANDFVKPSSFCSNQGALYSIKEKK